MSEAPISLLSISKQTRNEFILDSAASTTQTLGSRCYLDEAISLMHFLNGDIPVEAAVRVITAYAPSDPVQANEDLAAGVLSQLWKLVVNSLVYLIDDRDKIIDLLICIQTLPSAERICWWKLPNLAIEWAAMRDICASALYHNRRSGIGKTAHLVLVHIHTAGAKMLIRGVHGMTGRIGFEMINMICYDADDLNDTMPFMHAWYEYFERCAERRRYEVPVYVWEHWHHWKWTFLRLGRKGEALPEEGSSEESLSKETRNMAMEYYHIMEALLTLETSNIISTMAGFLALKDPCIYTFNLKKGAEYKYFETFYFLL
ncbi:hypothetical protein DER45DRAFT_595833 [Fusarium avenaceum]|nr:hypothetical protein DER45DRAFT_595833 [Fusarium avenaceum]